MDDDEDPTRCGPPPQREKAPSLHDVWEAYTGSHSRPPAGNWIGWQMFLASRRLVKAGRWMARTAIGTAVAALASATVSAAVTHALHLLAPEAMGEHRSHAEEPPTRPDRPRQDAGLRVPPVEFGP